ncbi:1-deoxy-D-xylulose-5-phosphate synthase [Roseateles sp.]|uniref:1-deoxy-D-xylulose-5-phosphate synthase n=1 Tax=Roseateles sp. TaxID=1971397 RepID=UPI00326416DF
MKRIMYIEDKSAGLDGHGRIGWVEMSRSARSYTYAGRRFLKTKSGYKYNCFEEGTGARYWISGPKRRGGDKLYGGAVEIDEDARLAYWTEIRGRPESTHLTQAS